ncbi:MAG: triose-phosphate isomerase [Puniceicoccales bacterium]|jgi:triosephosphate isomerase|nr:triose-phosphate isomerase [Puniceicoccales bacterium]
MDRKYLIVGNWKMNRTPSQSVELAEKIVDLKTRRGISPHIAVAICPPFTSLDRCTTLLKGTDIAIGAQNLYFEKEGAFTGEISPSMLKDLGVSHVIIGHSERRAIFHETDELIHQKVKAAQGFQLTPILCVGETLRERESGQTLAVIEGQISRTLEGITDSKLVIAYEPVWAIGTGKTATPETAQEVHQFIRGLLQKQFGKEGIEMHILYGGSMKPDNAAELLRQPDITGGLIGGASLIAESFMDIVTAAEKFN